MVMWHASIDPDGDEVHYRVEYRPKNSIIEREWTVAVGGTARTYYTLTGLVPATPYDVRVCAIDSKEAQSEWNDSRISHPNGLFRTKPVHLVEAPKPQYASKVNHVEKTVVESAARRPAPLKTREKRRVVTAALKQES